MFHTADVIGYLNGVPNNVLIFQHDIEPGDHIANESLRAKTDGHAREAGERECWCGVDPDLVQSREQSHDPDNFAARTVEDSSQSARLLLAELSGSWLCSRLW